MSFSAKNSRCILKTCQSYLEQETFDEIYSRITVQPQNTNSVYFKSLQFVTITQIAKFELFDDHILYTLQKR